MTTRKRSSSRSRQKHSRQRTSFSHYRTANRSRSKSTERRTSRKRSRSRSRSPSRSRTKPEDVDVNALTAHLSRMNMLKQNQTAGRLNLNDIPSEKLYMVFGRRTVPPKMTDDELTLFIRKYIIAHVSTYGAREKRAFRNVYRMPLLGLTILLKCIVNENYTF